MEPGDLLTRATIWMALAAYALAEARRSGGARGPRLTGARQLFTVGCLLYLAHVTLAFGYHYDWSHAAAYRSTAAQTATMTGWAWGGGLFVNYAFTALWVSETLWWWLAPAGYGRRPAWIGSGVRVVFGFMVLNGAVVFVDGPMRGVGVAIAAGLGWVWWRRPASGHVGDA